MRQDMSVRAWRQMCQRISDAKDKTRIRRGRMFGYLVVLSFAGRDKFGSKTWKCRCTRNNCGNIKVVGQGPLRSGDTTSCGCFRRDTSRKAVRALSRMGMYRDGRKGVHRAEGGSYLAMIRRCTDLRDVRYHLYGGAGVKVCAQWLDEKNGFKKFRADLGPKPRPYSDYSIGRFLDTGDYKPGNCKWMTRKEQAAEARKKRQILRSVR
jgi:hypothetical protein